MEGQKIEAYSIRSGSMFIYIYIYMFILIVVLSLLSRWKNITFQLTFSEKSNSVKRSPCCVAVVMVVVVVVAGGCRRAPYQPLTPPVTFVQLENR